MTQCLLGSQEKGAPHQSSREVRVLPKRKSSILNGGPPTQGAKRAFITLGAQIGGDVAYERTNEHILQLRRVLARRCTKGVSANLDEIALILRVDGEVQKFGFRGTRKPKYRKRQRFMEIEIGVPRASWARHSAKVFRDNLLKEVEHSVDVCLEELERLGVPINTRKLLKCLEKARGDFCSK
jgi:hypothetical protein